MLDMMRDPKRSFATIRSGLTELCDHLKMMFAITTEPIDRRIMYEVGSFAGESAEIFARFFKTVHCVDPWDPALYDVNLDAPELVELSFDARCNLAGNIVKHKGDSVSEAEKVPDGSLDFVYVDALHDFEHVAVDLAAWAPKVSVGGFVGGHDGDAPGVEKAIKAFFGPARTVLHFADLSWIVRIF